MSDESENSENSVKCQEKPTMIYLARFERSWDRSWRQHNPNKNSFSGPKKKMDARLELEKRLELVQNEFSALESEKSDLIQDRLDSEQRTEQSLEHIRSLRKESLELTKWV